MIFTNWKGRGGSSIGHKRIQAPKVPSTCSLQLGCPSLLLQVSSKRALETGCQQPQIRFFQHRESTPPAHEVTGPWGEGGGTLIGWAWIMCPRPAARRVGRSEQQTLPEVLDWRSWAQRNGCFQRKSNLFPTCSPTLQIRG